MPRRYERFTADLQGAARRAFEEANPGYWKTLQGRAGDIERVRRVEAHTEKTIRELEEEYQETRQDRIGRMALEVFEERIAVVPGYDTPIHEDRLSQTSILKEARKRVDLAHEGDLEAVRENSREAIRTLAFNDHPEDTKEGHTMSDQAREHHFKAAIHKAVEDAAEARNQARRLFAKNREVLIEEARTDGSEAPEKDVSIAQAQTMRQIDRQEHKDLHAAFLRYGWSRDAQEVEFHARDEDKAKTNWVIEEASNLTKEQVPESRDQYESEDPGRREEAEEDKDPGEREEPGTSLEQNFDHVGEEDLEKDQDPARER